MSDDEYGTYRGKRYKKVSKTGKGSKYTIRGTGAGLDLQDKQGNNIRTLANSLDREGKTLVATVRRSNTGTSAPSKKKPSTDTDTASKNAANRAKVASSQSKSRSAMITDGNPNPPLKTSTKKSVRKAQEA